MKNATLTLAPGLAGLKADAAKFVEPATLRPVPNTMFLGKMYVLDLAAGQYKTA